MSTKFGTFKSVGPGADEQNNLSCIREQTENELLLHILSRIIRIATLGACDWAGNLGEEHRLLATVLSTAIVVYELERIPSDINFRNMFIVGKDRVLKTNSNYETVHLL